MGRILREMNEYEILLMLDPELAEERGGEIVARVRERVEADGGRWDGHEPWGRRKLAYEIDHKTEASTTCSCSPPPRRPSPRSRAS